MTPPRDREAVILSALCCALYLGSTVLAWRAAGWLGVGVLGLFTLFVAVRMDLEGDRPIGPPMTPGLHAAQYRQEAEEHRAGRAARRAGRAALARPLRLAGLLGALGILIGFGGLIWTQIA